MDATTSSATSNHTTNNLIFHKGRVHHCYADFKQQGYLGFKEFITAMQLISSFEFRTNLLLRVALLVAFGTLKSIGEGKINHCPLCYCQEGPLLETICRFSHLDMAIACCSGVIYVPWSLISFKYEPIVKFLWYKFSSLFLTHGECIESNSIDPCFLINSADPMAIIFVFPGFKSKGQSCRLSVSAITVFEACKLDGEGDATISNVLTPGSLTWNRTEMLQVFQIKIEFVKSQLDSGSGFMEPQSTKKSLSNLFTLQEIVIICIKPEIKIIVSDACDFGEKEEKYMSNVLWSIARKT
ncbi:hypothetical protein L2E82_51772 [Cichorium intybus]|nr:hypothetical protein L2E82_51772 [Cichorium intybus]